jgi:hypothetical protein
MAARQVGMGADGDQDGYHQRWADMAGPAEIAAEMQEQWRKPGAERAQT